LTRYNGEYTGGLWLWNEDKKEIVFVLIGSYQGGLDLKSNVNLKLVSLDDQADALVNEVAAISGDVGVSAANEPSARRNGRSSTKLHKGFAVLAADTALQLWRLRQTWGELGAKNIVITGHSQGAATGALLSILLDELDGRGYQLLEGMAREAIVFAQPQCALRPTPAHMNKILNFRHAWDPMTFPLRGPRLTWVGKSVRVQSEYWGFKRIARGHHHETYRDYVLTKYMEVLNDVGATRE